MLKSAQMREYSSSERPVRANSNDGQSYKHRSWGDSRSKVGRVRFCTVHRASVRLGRLSGSWGDSRPLPSSFVEVSCNVLLPFNVRQNDGNEQIRKDTLASPRRGKQLGKAPPPNWRRRGVPTLAHPRKVKERRRRPPWTVGGIEAE